MALSNKLLAFLNFLHIEKQYHNKLTSEHILLHDNQIYLISGNEKLHNTPQRDIEAFGDVLREMLKEQREIHPFYKDILEKCAGGGDYFRTISDVLYRFKNRVKIIGAVPESFDRYVLEELNKGGFPPSNATRKAIKERAYRMVIDDELVNRIIRRNSDKVTPVEKGVPRWVWLLLPVLFIVGLFMWRSNSSGSSEKPPDVRFDLQGEEKQEISKSYSFVSNAERGKNLLWKVYDFSGKKIEQKANETTFNFIPQKPGKYFVTLENVLTPEGVFKDTIEVLWPGGKAQFDIERLSDYKFKLTNKSTFADSVFYDMGEGMKRMTSKNIEYEYTDITKTKVINIQFAAYSNGQADLQTQTFTLKPPQKPTKEIPEPKPKTSSSSNKKKYKKPVIRVMSQNYVGKTIGFRLSSASYDKRLEYEWEVSGVKKTGRVVTFSTVGQNVMQLRLRVLKNDEVIHSASKLVSIQKENEKIDAVKDDNSLFKPIEGTDLFKDNQ